MMRTPLSVGLKKLELYDSRVPIAWVFGVVRYQQVSASKTSREVMMMMMIVT
jgi:hypothetical protein